MKRATPLLAAALFAACGGHAPAQTPAHGSGTVSGDFSGAFDCSAVTARSQSDPTVVTMTLTPTAYHPSGAMLVGGPQLSVKGDLAARDYGFADAVAGGAVVEIPSGGQWSASWAPDGGSTGAVTFHLTKVTPSTGAQPFQISGTVDATLYSAGGAAVQVNASF